MAQSRITKYKSKDYEHFLAGALAESGWTPISQEPPRARRPDMLFEAEGRRYWVELKVSSEGRRDRLMPLLSQAILQAQAATRETSEPFVAVAVVAAPRVSAAMARQIVDWGHGLSPDVAVGVIDAEGLRVFAGHGLAALDAEPARQADRRAHATPRPQLFSNLNQWMLKVLLGQRLPPDMITVPRGRFDNASRLAEASGVSVMSAYRLLRRLADDGFLEEGAGYPQVVRIEDLLVLWASAARQTVREIPARWIIRRNPEHLSAALATYRLDVARTKSALSASQGEAAPRCCLGLFAAADALGLGVVHGVPPHVYIERMDPQVLERLGLRTTDSQDGADVILRVPGNREAVFRAGTQRDGVPVADVLQIWLDVSVHPSRGREQAMEIRKRALGPSLGLV